MGATKKILGIRITRDRKNHELRLSQVEYIENVRSRFNMQDEKPINTPLVSHFRLSKEESPKIEKEKNHMSRVLYALVMGRFMYIMVSTRFDIA